MHSAADGTLLLVTMVVAFAIKLVGDVAYVHFAQRRFFPAATRNVLFVALGRAALGLVATLAISATGVGAMSIGPPSADTDIGAVFTLGFGVALAAQLVARVVCWGVVAQVAYGKESGAALRKFVLGGVIVSYVVDVPMYAVGAVVLGIGELFVHGVPC